VRFSLACQAEPRKNQNNEGFKQSKISALTPFRAGWDVHRKKPESHSAAGVAGYGRVTSTWLMLGRGWPRDGVPPPRASGDHQAVLVGRSVPL